ncbi:MAG: ChaN family lipoprotein [Nitrospirae bacterium]|nr:ChaN family lipoprotein [Nitrospirota bacterium]
MKSQIIIAIVLTLSVVCIAYPEETSPDSNLPVSSSITSYLTELLLAKEKGNGWQYRKKMLIDYQSYFKPSDQEILKDLNEKIDAVIPERGAMFFHMLKKLIGEDVFKSALEECNLEKSFADVSWNDVENIFEKVSGQDLEWFFNQWLIRDEIPFFEVKNLQVIIKNGFPNVSFEIIQKEQPFKLFIPVKIITEKGDKNELIQFEEKKKKFEIPVEERPLKIIFDENYDILRKLSDKEFPAILSRFFRDEEKLVIFSEEERYKYTSLIDIFEKNGYLIKEEKEIRDKDIKESSLLVLGFKRPILKRLFGKITESEKGFFLIVKKNPLNEKKVVVCANSESEEEVNSVGEEIFQYGQYSLINFQNGKVIKKVTEDSERGMSFSLFEPVLGINPGQTLRLEEVINTVIEKPIIYVGERHTNYEDHKVQLELIMELSKQGRKFAIGMEMFQKPFQKPIDDYLASEISEREFLKKTEYFKRWKFDYNLYREIIEFAKSKDIPVIALNIREEIIKKVSEGGLDALTEEERKEIPQDMDMYDEAYKERLKKVFELHEKSRIKDFEYFRQSQILWDETMAHSIAEFMNNNPDYQMIVLAGEQHIIYGSGIPKRTYRLNGKDYVTLINGIPDKLENDIGDFVLFPLPINPPVSPKLGVLLKEEKGKVWVEDLLPESIASKAGIKEGDILLSVDNWKIESVEDVKIALFDKKEGDKIKAKIIRKKFFRGKKTLELEITL